MKFKLVFSFIYFTLGLFISSSNYDLTLVGSLNFSGSLARISISIIDLLKNDLKINFIKTVEINYKDIPLDVFRIISKNTNNESGNVCLFTDVLWLKYQAYQSLYDKLPNSKIKIAYSMIESTKIPPIWTKILNQYFDAVVVPDKYFVKVYQNSGVEIPIFTLPIRLYIEDFLNKPLKEKSQNKQIFTFGCSAVGWERKNLDLLVKSFGLAFKNNNFVTLKIHSKCEYGINELNKLIKKYNFKNISLINKKLTRNEYLNLFSSFDCYVLLSKGEGFSITPREALALGIPCILSDNTAHKTICRSGFVYPVTSSIKEPSYYEVFDQVCGVHFNCKIEDVVTALKEVYHNYDIYLKKARAGRKWVKRYLHQNLKDKYLNLIKPKRIILGIENKITQNYLMTNSSKLYNKYLEINKLNEKY